MSLNRIKLFSFVAKYANLTKASQVLHVSQSAISHQLSLLQNDYRVKLYNKHSRGIELTTDGKEFLYEVEPILERFERFERKFRLRLDTDLSSSLSVGGTYGLSAGFLPSLLADYQKIHSDVQVCLRTGNQVAIEQLILKGEVEIALMILADHLSPLLVMEPYRKEQYAAFVSVHHALAKQKTVTVGELLQTPLVIRGERQIESDVGLMLKELESKGYKPKIGGFYDSPEAVKVAVKRKAGVGILYKDHLRNDFLNGGFKILKVEGLNLLGQSFIVYMKDKSLSPNATLFLELMRQRKQRDRSNRSRERALSTSAAQYRTSSSEQNGQAAKDFHTRVHPFFLIAGMFELWI